MTSLLSFYDAIFQFSEHHKQCFHSSPSYWQCMVADFFNLGYLKNWMPLGQVKKICFLCDFGKSICEELALYTHHTQHCFAQFNLGPTYSRPLNANTLGLILDIWILLIFLKHVILVNNPCLLCVALCFQQNNTIIMFFSPLYWKLIIFLVSDVFFSLPLTSHKLPLLPALSKTACREILLPLLQNALCWAACITVLPDITLPHFIVH